MNYNIIWIVVGIVLIVAAAVSVWWWYSKKLTIDATTSSLAVTVGGTRTSTINNYAKLTNPSVKSSNTSIVTAVLATTGIVTITGVSIGSATVSIKADNAKTLDLKMTVSADEIVLSATTATVAVNGTKTIQVTNASSLSGLVVTSHSTAIATATLTNDTITITGKMAGNTDAIVSATGMSNVTISVTVS